MIAVVALLAGLAVGAAAGWHLRGWRDARRDAEAAGQVDVRTWAEQAAEVLGEQRRTRHRASRDREALDVPQEEADPDAWGEAGYLLRPPGEPQRKELEA